jgi:membrane protein implicated in regulation of membrane protease activity
VITNQETPSGGFTGPAGGFLARWWLELAFGGAYLVGGVFMSVFSMKRDRPLLLVLEGIVLFAAGWVFYNDGWRLSPALFATGIVLLALGVYRLIRRSRKSGSHIRYGR